MKVDRIHIEAPATNARRDRVEQEVFSQLAGIRAADRAEAIAPRAQRPRPRLAIWLPAAACLAAAAIAVVVLVGRDQRPVEIAGPSLVETPVGGSSRFTVGDAVVQAGSDTSVSVSTSDAGVMLVLGRGAIDCDVEPRNGRAPFRVQAGDVDVEVIGTRFAVTRVGAGARVDVTRGKVRVRSAGSERFLTAGQSWTPSAITASVSPPPPARIESPTEVVIPQPTTETPDSTEPRLHPAPREPTRREAFALAQQLESKDVQKAARAYRSIASGSDSWAALALYSLAELQASSDAKQALRSLDELARRFPNGANTEDAGWLRVDVLRRNGRHDEARAAAESYLRAFPRGTYAKQAGTLAAPR